MILEVTEDLNFLIISEASEQELDQMRFSMKKRTENFFFHPLYKKKLWDGYVHFMDKHQRIPVGLWYEVKKICKDNNFECKIRGLKKIIDTEFNETDFNNWCDIFFKDSEIKPYDYQIDAAKKILKLKRSVSEIATSAGKTLIIFMIFTYLKQRKNYKNFLFIVPNISLIEQTIDKFEKYSDDFNLVNYKFQMILSGESKERKSDCNIVIGTYQSLSKLNNHFFDDIDGVCVDESHYTSAVSIQKILNKMKNTHFRFGVSGTTKVKNVDNAGSFTIQGSLGPFCNSVTNHFLTTKGYTTPVEVRALVLNYLKPELKEKLRNIKYNKSAKPTTLLKIERKIVTEHTRRFRFLIDKIKSSSGNNLVLFADVSGKYGHRIYEKLCEELDDSKQIFYIDGSTPKEIREVYRNEAAKNDTETIIVASFGVFSTGIDIPNINNIFLTESFKSQVIIKQSIGRGMRKDGVKTKVVVYDLVDDFRIPGSKYQNYLYKHFLSRCEIYKSEKFNFNKIKINI